MLSRSENFERVVLKINLFKGCINRKDMTEKITKPRFEEAVGLTAMNLDGGLTFNAQGVGPLDFAGLRGVDYGQGFRMPTMPELVSLVHASLENKNIKTAKLVVDTLRQYWLSGNTGVRWIPNEGMYLQDNPELIDGRVFMDEKVLRDKLSRDDNGISYSGDKSVRFVPYGFKVESQSSLDLTKNRGIIALVNGEENAEQLAKASQHYRKNPWFYAFGNVDSPQTRVAVLSSDDLDGRLRVKAYGDEDFDSWYSFRGTSVVAKMRSV